MSNRGKQMQLLTTRMVGIAETVSLKSGSVAIKTSAIVWMFVS
jgi:hypothetical protein